jgi:chloramphenicol 3-O-phosphotransferase
VVVVTGIMAAGKSTVAALLAERFERAAHVRGDLFRRMIVRGRADIRPGLDAEARAQLDLRHALMAAAADAYAAAGLSVVAQDILVGNDLPNVLSRIHHRPLYAVVLAPDVDAVRRREAGRTKTGYSSGWTVEDLDRGFRADTPRIGLWLDTSSQTPAQTVDEIWRRMWTEAAWP